MVHGRLCSHFHAMTAAPQLTALRKKIDAVDADLLDVLARRQSLVEQVLAIKQQDSLPARIPYRIQEVIDGASSRATLKGVNPDLARTVWTAMVEWFVSHEETMLKEQR